MTIEQYAQIYFASQISYQQQLVRFQDAQLALQEFKPSGIQPDDNLRQMLLASTVRDQNELLVQSLEQLGDDALPIIEELENIEYEIGKPKAFEIPDEDRFFEIVLEEGRKLTFLGPYSRIK